MANGIIVDPSGIGTTGTTSNDDSNGNSESSDGGCFIHTVKLSATDTLQDNVWREGLDKRLVIILLLLVVICAGRLPITRSNEN